MRAGEEARLAAVAAVRGILDTLASLLGGASTLQQHTGALLPGPETGSAAGPAQHDGNQQQEEAMLFDGSVQDCAYDDGEALAYEDAAEELLGTSGGRGLACKRCVSEHAFCLQPGGPAGNVGSPACAHILIEHALWPWPEEPVRIV